MQTHRFVAGLIAAGLATAGVLVTPAGALAVSADIVVSQVYGGGGNTGAQYTNDFIELYNRGGATVSVSGWTVQYASATGSTWSKTSLSGTIAAGHYYLVAEAAGAGSGAPLPAPDATGTIAMSATAGKVALVTNSTALTCSTGCASQPGVKDFIGYGGTASSYEGSPTANLSNTTAALRNGAGATDTDNNAADFTLTAPNPRNSSFSAGLRIHDIQSNSHLSPYNGRAVSVVPGIVTAKDSKGFWLQDPAPDANPATSEGVYVYVASAPSQVVGDSVKVSGTVNEFRPANTATNLTTTEITSPTVTLLAHGQPLPAPTLVGTGGRVPPATVIEDDATGDVENSGVFDPASDGIDFWESLEGMRVELDSPTVVGPTNQFGEIPVVPAGSTTRTNRGGIVLRANDSNPERVIVDKTLAPTPTVSVGDTLSGAVIGQVTYAFGNPHLAVTTTPGVVSGGIQQEVTTPAGTGQLAVATFNVENLAPADPVSKFDALAAQIVGNLKAPDLIAVEEVQDNSGATDDGTVAANVTLANLTAAVTRAGGPAYTWREIDPVNDQDGGQPGGNIRQVFLYRTDRGLSFVDRPGGTSTNSTGVTGSGSGTALTFSPGRIDPGNSAWTSSRKPLAGEFRWNGRTVFVIANHFNSKGGDQPLYGRFQPPTRSSETQRHQQATVVRGFVNQLLVANPSADVVVLGDLNDFDYSDTTSILTSGGALLDLPATLPAAERYTYVFEGNSQVLDHILLSGALSANPYGYDIVHTNSEFANQTSDHDPQVVRLQP
jgi:predicted extracellular nuclease